MTIARKLLVDENVTPWYHCISRCVRRAFLCGEGFEHRKDWIEERLKTLVEVTAIDCGGFAIMDNHLHLLLRLDSEASKGWSAEDVARRWSVLFPPKEEKGQGDEAIKLWVAQRAQDAEWIEKARGRLASLSWFMKCLKEPIARRANREDECTGAFWEGRFRSVAVLDEESLLATCAYIDLNPVAAGIVKTPEDSSHTSLAARLVKIGEKENGQVAHQSRDDSDPAWLMPVEDRRERGGCCGLLAGFTLEHYLRLVDWTSRLVRQGKSSVDAEVASIFERLGFDVEHWQATMLSLFGEKRLVGCFFGRPASLTEAARQLDRRWVKQRGTRAVVAG
ncbi:MAG: transposase [Planctomycetes bacterium]|nr:transposase [Planctomycetota bacterium]